MSLWRSSAISELPSWLSFKVNQSLGYYGLWNMLQAELSSPDCPQDRQVFLDALGKYCVWYTSKYEKRPDMMAAFCYGFAEHLSSDDYNLFSTFVTPRVQEILRMCIDSAEEQRRKK